MKQRIDLIVNPRDAIDAWKSVHSATTRGGTPMRERLMEIVAWLLVSKFKCRLEGGFVRDWVVAGQHSRPSTPLPWVTFKATGIPVLDPALTPADLDVQLPMRFFSMRFFRDRLFQLGITIAKTISEPWRTLLVFFPDTENVFTVDLIEPHVAATHDAIDFDVNNMYLTKEVLGIGLRVDVTDEPLLLSLESHVENAQRKHALVLRDEGDFGMPERSEGNGGCVQWCSFTPGSGLQR